ncbi:MmgE/PrpD family protein [Henriciella sp. AS95]|uniref:MmgE/PrpD family protein n=1 Tax=Henriciella sp. AS95 TaxID=3135782 RepID=UPI003171BB1D
MSGHIAEPTVLRRLAGMLQRPVAPADRQRARLHLLDWIGCAIAGAREEVGKAFCDQKNVLADVFRWGALGNILEMDDVDKRAILHCGPSIIPAALALAGQASGDRLLDAIVRGYEATIRLGRACGPAHYATWHSTATCGPIGSAAAAATMLGADEDELCRAMSLGVSQAAGFWQTRHEAASAGKQLHTAHAARAGVDAARLAMAGLTGPLSILEGEQGFFAAMCPDGDPQAVLADYGESWLIHQVSFKPWPACRHAHPAIDAALLARAAGHDGTSVERVEVVSYQDAIKFCDRPQPNSVVESKFSLQHAVAITLLKGKPGLMDFSIPAISDPATAALRKKVHVAAGSPYSDDYPARFGAEIRLHGADGEISVYKVPDALGDPENPLSENGILEKAVGLLQAGGLSKSEASDLADAVLGLNAERMPAAVMEALP